MHDDHDDDDDDDDDDDEKQQQQHASHGNWFPAALRLGCESTSSVQVRSDKVAVMWWHFWKGICMNLHHCPTMCNQYAPWTGGKYRLSDS